MAHRSTDSAEPAPERRRRRGAARHLVAGAVAGATAASLRRGSRLRRPVAALAVVELVRGLRRRQAAPGSVAPEGQTGEPRRALVEGVEMRWEERGDVGSPTAVPVVLVHGIPTDPSLWRYVAPRIARDGVRVLATELVGFGESMQAGFGRDISVAAQAEHIAAWMRHTGIARAILVGHDLGGGVVQRLATTHPDRCAGLVLVDCIAYDNWPVWPVRAAQRVAGLLERLPAEALPALLEGPLSYLGHDNVERRHESAALHLAPYARREGPRALAHQLRSLTASDTLSVAHELPRLEVPARVIWGERDPLGMASAEQLAEDLGAPLRVIPGARHFTPEDHPEVIAAAIDELVEELGRTSARASWSSRPLDPDSPEAPGP